MILGQDVRCRRNFQLVVLFFQLVLSSLESLYNLSGIGQVTSQHIAEVHRSIGRWHVTE